MSITAVDKSDMSTLTCVRNQEKFSCIRLFIGQCPHETTHMKQDNHADNARISSLLEQHDEVFNALSLVGGLLDPLQHADEPIRFQMRVFALAHDGIEKFMN